MSNSDLNELAEKIRKARGAEEKRAADQSVDDKADDRQGVQAGIELAGSIIISTAIGYGIDSWLDTKPAFILILFFLGVCTGFYNVYRISQNMGTAIGQSPQEKMGQKNDKNALPEQKKDAKTPEV